jgi:hypothetical protein
MADFEIPKLTAEPIGYIFANLTHSAYQMATRAAGWASTYEIIADEGVRVAFQANFHMEDGLRFGGDQIA